MCIDILYDAESVSCMLGGGDMLASLRSAEYSVTSNHDQATKVMEGCSYEPCSSGY